ncbi:venom serine carboxypeptidase-like isoform X2 [Ostrinia furnacalis]|uniref:venom serine carboxypeptidase-like isoform X1 n=2 Tax=Ostrinia furnacalis TaxID=93504 RepID=UPI00103AB5E0|nr:venom serine carboxypeptidase-like isoform X1 [Ostrinia furnacalis]XP_028171383.1 venom serine carboxypeptidase-like isoform X2 [Ostrinia furnacalis]
MQGDLINFKSFIVICVLISLISPLHAIIFPYVYPRLKLEAKTSGDAGDPLILTPYLKKGSIAEAQKLSRVSLTDRVGFPSHAGFFTVEEKYNSNLYFWYFPPISKNADAPVVLWLQGGPGGSSLFGLFTELGPLIAKKDGFALRKYHWALKNHLIFIDNPVGTGFSYTNDDKGYCSDEKCVAKGLYNAMQQFFTLFPDLRNNTFCITGESYAGKYIPALAMEIHNQNDNGDDELINLKCLAMGNAYCDPVHQIDYGNYLYQHGLIDNNQLEVFEKYQTDIAAEIQNENWEKADILMDKLMDGELTNFSYFKSYTGFTDYYNFLKTDNDDDMSIFTDLLQNDKLRHSIHVGGLPFNSGEEVQIHLAFDILKSVAPDITELLSHYRILFYNGQLDIIVAYPLTENFLRNLNFSSAEEYKKATRNVWKVGDDIAGYWKKAGNLTEVLVRNAGHMVPHDQPKWALNLITRFIQGKF